MLVKMFSKVDLPQPLAPTIPSISLSFIVRDILSSDFISLVGVWYVLERFFILFSHFWVLYYFEAITSISTRPPFGRVFTATAERAGKSNLKSDHRLL